MLGLFGLSGFATGLFAAGLSALTFGSSLVPLKLRSVVEADVDGGVFQLYFSLAIFLSSWLVLLYEPFVFTWYGVAGAALWVPASLMSIAAVRFVGLAVGMGVWAGTTVLVSFAWGAFYFQQPIKDPGLAVVALICLVLGVGALSFSGSDTARRLSNRLRGLPATTAGERTVIAGSSSSSPAPATEGSSLLAAAAAAPGSGVYASHPGSGVYVGRNSNNSSAVGEVGHQGDQVAARPMLGVACALVVGLLNGSMMVPLRLVPKQHQGIGYIVSFSSGVLVVTPVYFALYVLVLSASQRRLAVPPFQPRVAFVPGFCTGIMWQLGNYFSIYATLYLGLTIGFPLSQLAMVVSGLWGILAYREITHWCIALWLVGLVIIGTGATLLALFG